MGPRAVCLCLCEGSGGLGLVGAGRWAGSGSWEGWAWAWDHPYPSPSHARLAQPRRARPRPAPRPPSPVPLPLPASEEESIKGGKERAAGVAARRQEAAYARFPSRPPSQSISAAAAYVPAPRSPSSQLPSRPQTPARPSPQGPTSFARDACGSRRDSSHLAWPPKGRSQYVPCADTCLYLLKSETGSWDPSRPPANPSPPSLLFHT